MMNVWPKKADTIHVHKILWWVLVDLKEVVFLEYNNNNIIVRTMAF